MARTTFPACGAPGGTERVLASGGLPRYSGGSASTPSRHNTRTSSSGKPCRTAGGSDPHRAAASIANQRITTSAVCHELLRPISLDGHTANVELPKAFLPGC
jgi:hypothetical protein